MTALEYHWTGFERAVMDKRGRARGRGRADRRGVGRWRLGNEAQGGEKDCFEQLRERAKW